MTAMSSTNRHMIRTALIAAALFFCPIRWTPQENNLLQFYYSGWIFCSKTYFLQ